MEAAEVTEQPDVMAMTADLVCAYVSNHSLPAAELPNLILRVHGAFAGLLAPAAASTKKVAEKATPAQIKKSITPDALISFIDGKPYKSLKRHLTTHGISPNDYRTLYGLPDDYPMTSASYSAARSALAKRIGLGRPRQANDARTA